MVAGATRAKLRLPRGRLDFARQLGVWLGFGVAYQVARGLARGERDVALARAASVYRFEHRLGTGFEVPLQRHVLDAGSLLVHCANGTYWLSQFTVVGLVLLWVYIWRNDAYLLLRDTLIVTNALGLIGYVVFATAPPRMLPGDGFIDTLATSSALNHGTPLVELAANPYASIPSLHAADAAIVAVAVIVLVRRPAVRVLAVAWPVWVAFALIATGNHFWVDIALGFAAALVGVGVAGRLQRFRKGTRRPGRPPSRAGNATLVSVGPEEPVERR